MWTTIRETGSQTLRKAGSEFVGFVKSTYAVGRAGIKWIGGTIKLKELEQERERRLADLGRVAYAIHLADPENSFDELDVPVALVLSVEGKIKKAELEIERCKKTEANKSTQEEGGVVPQG